MEKKNLITIEKGRSIEYAVGSPGEIGEQTTVEQFKKQGLMPLTADEVESIQKATGKNLKTSTDFIRKHLGTVMEVAKELHIVHYSKLYRQKYNTFEEYVNEEFNYTLGRAYQLTRAHNIADYVNEKLNWKALTTESQCRALARLTVIDDEEDEEGENLKPAKKKLQAQLELVKDIVGTDQKEPKVKVIVEKVDEALKAKKDRDFKDPRFKRSTEIKSAFAETQKQINAIFAKSSEADMDEAKEITLEKLKELVAELENM